MVESRSGQGVSRIGPIPMGTIREISNGTKSNSGNRVQECGSHDIKANPLGLYDVLGNVEELTVNLFSPQYEQGRFGDFVVRGGNYSSSESDLSAAHRTEYLEYLANGDPRPVPIGGLPARA